MDEDDDVDARELFARELLLLSTGAGEGEEEEEEEDQSLRDLEDLGKQLRYSLHASEEASLGDGDAEWAALMESSKRASDRLALQEMTFESTIASSESEELKHRWTVLEDLRLQEAQINMSLNNLGHVVVPQTAAAAETDAQQSTVLSVVSELMASMLDSVEYTWKIVISKEREVANAVVLDYSKLPKMITDDIEEEGSNMDEYLTGIELYKGSSTSASEQLERERLQESISLLDGPDAEAILLKEAEEAARILEEDTQQRIQRKLRMMEEIMRAKSSKAATRIQTLQRGLQARAAVQRLRTKVRLEAERNAERLRVQRELELEKERVHKELELKRREFSAEKREMEGMRDEDLHSMQVRNWENLCLEREAQRKFAEREAERFFAEENFKNGRVFDEVVQTMMATSEIVPTTTREEEVAPNVVAATETTLDDEKIAMELLEDPWTRFGDAEEEAILKSQTPRAPPDAVTSSSTKAIPKSPTPSTKIAKTKKTTKKNRDSNNDEDDDDDDDESDGSKDNDVEDDDAHEASGADSDGDDEVTAEESLPAPAPPTTKQSNFGADVNVPLPKLMPPLLPLSAAINGGESPAPLDLISEFWHQIAANTIASSSAEIVFDATGVDKAVQLMQKKSNVLRIDVVDQVAAEAMPSVRERSSAAPAQSETPIVISPRAKVGGMKLVASRVSPRTGAAKVDVGAQSAKMKELDKENEVFRRRAAEQEKNRKALYKFILADEKMDRVQRRKNVAGKKMSRESPLIGALSSWQKFCEDELNLMHASLMHSSVSRSMEDSHGFESPLKRQTPAPNEVAEDDKIRQLGLRRDPANVKSIELNVEKLHSCSFLRNYTSAVRVELNVNRLCSLDGLKYMAGLEELSVKDNALTDIRDLRQTTALRTLSLDSNRLSDLSDLSKLSRLFSLSVSSNNLTAMPLLTGCVQLQRLELYKNQISEISIDSLKQLTTLTHLDLGRNKLEYIDGVALSHCVLLQTLVLSQNKLAEVPTPLHLPHLKILWLSGNKLDSLDRWLPNKAVAHLGVGEADWPVFGFLSADSSGVGEAHEAEQTYEWPTFMPMLEKLYLQDNSISNVNSSAMLCFPSLSLLDLSFNAIEHVSCLGVTACPKLRTLQIQENPVSTSTAGTDSLYRWLLVHCPSITSISGVDLSDSDKLADMKKAAAADVIREQVLSNFLLQDSLGDSSSFAVDSFPVACVGADFEVHHRLSNVDSFLQLVGMLQVEHAVFDANQKLAKKSPAQPDNAVFAWDLAYLDLLKRQVRTLLEWTEDATDDAAGNSYMVDYRSINSEPRVSSNVGKYDGKNAFQIRKIAATAIQALVRGFRARRSISRAFSAVQYKDEEIDEIDALLKSMDFGVSDVDLEYIGQKKPASSRQGWNVDPPPGSKLASESPMVYGDHRRSKQRANSSSSSGGNQDSISKSADFLLPPHQSAPKAEDDIPPHLSSWMSDNVARIRQALTGGGGGAAVQTSSSSSSSTRPSVPQSPRPSSAMSESSTITEGSLSSSAQGRVLDSGGNSPYRDNHSGYLRKVSSQQAASTASSTQAQMAQEWGINDPKVVAMMLKRNNRLSGLPINSGLGEAPSGTASSNKRKPVTVISGSFGGAKKTTKSTKRTSKGAPPAWAMGPHPGEEV